MPFTRTRVLFALALATVALAAAAAPAGAAAASAANEYTLDLPGGGAPAQAGQETTPAGVAKASDQGPQIGVTGETTASQSPLAAALDGPYAGVAVAALLATLTFGLFMGSARIRSPKQ